MSEKTQQPQSWRSAKHGFEYAGWVPARALLPEPGTRCVVIAYDGDGEEIVEVVERAEDGTDGPDWWLPDDSAFASTVRYWIALPPKPRDAGQ